MAFSTLHISKKKFFTGGRTQDLSIQASSAPPIDKAVIKGVISVVATTDVVVVVKAAVYKNFRKENKSRKSEKWREKS